MRSVVHTHFRRAAAAAALAVCCLGSAVCPVLASGLTLSEQLAGNNDYGVSFEYSRTDSYGKLLEEYQANGYEDAAEEDAVAIAARDYTQAAGTVTAAEDAREPGAVLLSDAVDTVEWTFTVSRSALYCIRLRYVNTGTSVNAASRALMLDRKYPFADAENISFPRYFRDEGAPVENNVGDEIAADPVELAEWQWYTVNDSGALYDAPLKFYLEAGQHTLSLGYISGDVYLSRIEVCAPQQLPAYSEVQELYARQGYTAGAGRVYFEAESVEHTLMKNGSTMAAASNGDPSCTPYRYGKATINVFGGTTWQAPNSEVTYRFTVEQDGLYAIALRVLMNYRDGIPSYRRISVDGAVPFQEFAAYKFRYGAEFRTEVLADAQGVPYYVYLTKGEHTLSLAVTQGELRSIETLMTADEAMLSELLLKIKMIIGQNPDTNYDYELEKQIPDLTDTLDTLMADMRSCMEQLETVSGRRMSKYYQLKSFISQLNNVRQDPFVIPAKISSLNEILTSYGSWSTEMTMHPLILDWVEILSDPAAATVRKSSWTARLWAGTVNFAQSFVKDYNNISVSAAGDVEIRSKISVWSARGTKWCSIMKQMIDSDFTAKTGIGVDLNVLPAGQLNAGGANALLLSMTSGKAPDVATGVSSSSIGEFAMRNALTDVSGFADFPQVAERFNANYFTALRYNGHTFALPETQNIAVMVYRKDIFSQLKLSLPNTWDELYDKVIPVLNQNNMQFYMPLAVTSFDMFLYQHGGSYYDASLQYTALDSAEAYNAMLEYTNLYLLYGVPKSASFYNRFRNGEMPIGVVDYNVYMQIKSVAGDLNGKWGVTPIPGRRQADGSVNRAHSSLTAECVMIIDQSTHQDEAWEFLKWWTDAATQTDYANRVETQIGKSARWNTATTEAFQNLSWEKSEKSEIVGSADAAVVPPVVLGGYYTSRHILNAYNRILMSNENVRTSMETAVEDINRELKRRRESA